MRPRLKLESAAIRIDEQTNVPLSFVRGMVSLFVVGIGFVGGGVFYWGTRIQAMDDRISRVESMVIDLTCETHPHKLICQGAAK